MDHTDLKILAILQEDASVSVAEVANRVNLSQTPCWRRIQRLEESGVIRRYAAILDASSAGLKFHAIVHVMLTRHDHGHVDTFIAEVGRRPEVLDCYATTGEADYHLRVVCEDLDAYNRFLEGFLFRLPGIANVRTNLVLKDIKQETAVPV